MKLKGFGLKELKSLGSVGLRMMNKNLPCVLSGFAIFGVVATAYTAFKAAPEVKSAIDDKKRDKSDAEETKEVTLTPFETAVAVVPYIWKPVACGAFTVGCIVGAQVLNVQRLTMLAGAYKLSETKLKEYEEKAKEFLGEKKAGELHDAVAKETRDIPLTENTDILNTGKGDLLCFDTFSGRYFRSSVEAIREAESKLNKVLISGDFVQLNDLYDELRLPHIKMGTDFGWEAYHNSVAPYLDIKLSYDTEDFGGEQKVVCVVDYNVDINSDSFHARLC